MDEIEFKFIGWMKEGAHDKVWVSFAVGRQYYCAWGRRGAKLQFKKHEWRSDLYKVESQKEKKGYKEVDQFLLFTLFPDFHEKVEKELMMKILSGQMM